MERIKRMIEYLRGIIGGQSKKKIIENSIIFIIIGAIIIIAGGAFWGKDKKQEEGISNPEISGAQAVSKTLSDKNDAKSELEKRIEAVLSQIEGAGNVNVMVTYASGKELVPAYDIKRNDNDTSEKDTGGGTRNVKESGYESKIVYEEEQGGKKKPIIVKEIQPQVIGVVIVAEGASDPVVRENLSRAVQVLVDVPIHRIQVFEKVSKK